MKYLIIGLGNPGDKYKNTRHNIGFTILDAFADASNICFEPDRLADRAVLKFKGRTLILIKPNTFMNLSGKAVNYWIQKEKIATTNLLVITDDIALPFGKIRIKPKGSDGGHNGLKDIQLVLNSNKYSRLRFGVGSEFNPGNQVNYVLGEWSKEEEKALEERAETIGNAIKSFVTIGLDRTMNEFNNK